MISNVHAHVGVTADDPSAEINKGEWNAEHVLTQATAKVLGRTTADTGAVEELAVVAPIALGAGTITTSMATGKLLGRSTASAGVAEEIAVGTSLDLSAGALSVSGAALLGTKGAIQGLELGYNSGTIIDIGSGVCSINNKVLSFAGPTSFTSGSTMKDLDGNTVTLAANKCYSAFAKDVASTLEIRFQNMNGSGSGNDPDFSFAYDYWESINGPSERRIGAFWTDGSGNIFPFKFVSEGRLRTYTIDALGLPLVNGVSNASFTSIVTEPYIRNDATQLKVGLGVSGNNTTAGTQLSLDAGASVESHLNIGTTVSVFVISLAEWHINTQGLRYKSLAAADSYVYLAGYRMFV